ncbi:hypothetical protein ES703_70246 [subsurface metagenome]
MTKSHYITSPSSDMVLPEYIAGSKGTTYDVEEALSVVRSVLSECISAAEHAYIQDSDLKRALRRSLRHLYGLRAKAKEAPTGEAPDGAKGLR